jgi:hypothetical protein
MAKGQFRVTRLEALLQRGRDEPLGVGSTHFLAEEIGVATKILDGGERDRVHAILDDEMAGGRESGDPMSEGVDEIPKCIGGRRAVDPAVPLR